MIQMEISVTAEGLLTHQSLTENFDSRSEVCTSDSYLTTPSNDYKIITSGTEIITPRNDYTQLYGRKSLRYVMKFTKSHGYFLYGDIKKIITFFRNRTSKFC